MMGASGATNRSRPINSGLSPSL